MKIKKEVEYNPKYIVAGTQSIVAKTGAELIIISLPNKDNNFYANGCQPIIN